MSASKITLALHSHIDRQERILYPALEKNRQGLAATLERMRRENDAGEVAEKAFFVCIQQWAKSGKNRQEVTKRGRNYVQWVRGYLLRENGRLSHWWNAASIPKLNIKFAAPWRNWAKRPRLRWRGKRSLHRRRTSPYPCRRERRTGPHPESPASLNLPRPNGGAGRAARAWDSMSGPLTRHGNTAGGEFGACAFTFSRPLSTSS